MYTEKNHYFLENEEGSGYSRVTRRRLNRMVKQEQAEWIGTDYNQDRNAYEHYARRLT